MKKVILFIAAMLLVGTTARATDQKLSDQIDRVPNRYRSSKPIVFFEGGVTFFVYPNGEVDFKTPNTRRNKHANWNDRTYKTAKRFNHNRSNNRFSIQYDYYGRLKRVRNNFISYTRHDQVRRIGSVPIQYNRAGLVYKIGGLRIYYNRYNRIREIEGDVHYRDCGYYGSPEYRAPQGSHYELHRHPNKNNPKNDRYNDQDDHLYKDRKRKIEK